MTVHYKFIEWSRYNELKDRVKKLPDPLEKEELSGILDYIHNVELGLRFQLMRVVEIKLDRYAQRDAQERLDQLTNYK